MAWRKYVGICVRDNHGIAAVEFAFVFPVLLLVFVGAVDVSQAVTTSSKVETLTRTLADLLSQQATSTVSASTPTTASAAAKNLNPASILSQIALASTGLLYPASTVSLTITISGIDIVNKANGQCCNANVRWSFTQPSTQPTPGASTLRPCYVPLTPVTNNSASLTTIPSAMMPSASVTTLSSSISVVIADVSFTYTPLFNSVPFPTISRTGYMYPRTPGQVVIDPATMPASGSQYGLVCY